MTISTLELIHELLKIEKTAAEAAEAEADAAARKAYPDKAPADGCIDPVWIRYKAAHERNALALYALREFESNEW